MRLAFWLSFLLIFYAYLGYGLLLYALVWWKRRLARPAPAPAVEDWPEVAVVICAYNEADWIVRKLENTLALDYPRERMQLWLVTDGSTDATPELVRTYPFPPSQRWTLLHEPARRGKIAAFDRAMQRIDAPIVVSTDANTFVNTGALKNLVRPFADPRVGAVAGEKRIELGERDDASSAGEGIYWKYESALKRWDAELWTVVGAAGELFAFRRALYEPVPPDTIVEDFYMTMRIAQRGHRVQYAPDAYASERSSASVQEELKRKVRIAAGGWQAFVRLAPLLNVFRYGLLSFQYISHRVLRWVAAPVLLPVLLVLNIGIAAQEGAWAYRLILAGQIAFYAAALAGWALERRKMKIKVFFVPYYFCVMNYAQYAGFFRYLRGGQSVLWERARRRGA